jgi:hypothetical protein
VDVRNLEAEVTEGLEIILADEVEQVLEVVLARENPANR